MKRFLLQRLLFLIPLLLGVSILVFLILHLIPGDPAIVLLGEHASPLALHALREKLGLNEPLYKQFARFLWGLCKLDLGESIQTNNSAFHEVFYRLPATVELAFSALILAVFLGVSLGVLSARFKGSWLDNFISTFSVLGFSIPIFWIGIMLILLFAVHLAWFPISGRVFIGSIFETPTHFYTIDSILSGNPAIIKDVFSHLVLPALTLSTIPMALITRTTRAGLFEVEHQDYVRTALAKGLTPWNVLWRHSLKNALLPVITVIGLQCGTLLGGAVLTETVFNWPGLGRLLVEAVKARDYPVVEGAVFVIALIFILVNSLADVACAWVDPRIHPS